MPLARTVYRRKCFVCGQAFETTAYNAECCSGTCRQAKYRARRKGGSGDAAVTSVKVVAPARAVASAPPRTSPAPRPAAGSTPAAGPDPDDAPPEDGVLAATTAAIPAGATPWKRAVVLALATRLDNSLMDNASSVAALSKRYEDAMRDLLAESPGDDEPAPWDVDE